MLTVMCPNCRHRFPAPGCCNPGGSVVIPLTSNDEFSTSCGVSYCPGGGDYLVPRGYLNGGGICVINAPTIIHNPTIINGENDNSKEFAKRIKQQQQQQQQRGGKIPRDEVQTVETTATITSGINNKVEKPLSPISSIEEPNLQRGIFQNPHPMLFPAPSGCQELPGARSRVGGTGETTAFNFQITEDADWTRTKNVSWPNCDASQRTFTLNSAGNNAGFNSATIISDNKNSLHTTTAPSSGGGTVIQVNATLQLPPNVAHCTVSITATANTAPNSSGRSRNNFNGGGIVETDVFAGLASSSSSNGCERDENSPTTPVSWVLPFPWGMNGNTGNNVTDLERLSAAQRVLQMSGWYHEGLSWQQSAALLKNAPVGSWLIRDSSDKRYMYAVSVQTARGPTAVRVHYVSGRFRLDAEPRMAPLMPMFECPVKMIEHYIKYSKKMYEQKEVWVDHSGQLYSQIYLTKPLLKEVRSLSHLARLAVNRSNISTKQLPLPLREYIADYPYTE